MKLCWIMFAVLAASLLLGADGAARRRRVRHGQELELQREKRLVEGESDNPCPKEQVFIDGHCLDSSGAWTDITTMVPAMV